MQRASLVVRSLWAAGLLVGGLNHGLILLRHGPFWDYGGVAWPSAAYWTSLTVLDPVVAVLLFLRPRVGVVATILLISTNVVHNLAIAARFGPEADLLARATANPFILSQVGFMLFVWATAPTAWQGEDRGGM